MTDTPTASGPFLPQEIIRAKRDGEAVPAGEIARFVEGLVDGRVTEAQAAAFAMAVFFSDMTRDEAVALTDAMMRSGDTLDWELDGPVLDKHSTGGVGDVVSLMLAPMVAACGGYVPMVSGRGLGHTGGTLDKLDSVPGYATQPDTALFRRTVAAAGCAIIGQTADLAPADRILYAIRDVTGTVESIPLITASILSKKLAAGLDGLVLDVKTGSGAFMPTLEKAQALADSLVAVANGAGLKASALLTDMDQPLARAAGNALEVHEAIDYLTGARRDARLHAVTLALGAEMLVLGGLAETADVARDALEAALDRGTAAERFQRMVVELGGPSDLVEDPDRHLARAAVTRDVLPEGRGTVATIDARTLGLAVVGLGGGRTRAEDPIDHAVGLDGLALLGAEVGPDMPIARVHARDEAEAIDAAERVRNAYTLGEAPHVGPAVIGRVEAPV